MKVSMIGTGYVGLVSGTCFSEIGHDVTCIDIDPQKIKTLKEGKCPIYEPGLTDLLERNIEAKRLKFSSDYFSVKDKAIVVIKSTVPVGTNQMVRNLIKEKTDKEFYVVNNPEFLKEGSAVEDFMRPDRVVIGHDNEFASQMMAELYAPLVRQGNPIYMMSNLSAEMTKYAANCFLATKISFINEIARLCDVVGADIFEVRKGISSDRRIGGHFLYPGPGYGGSCFPKDVKALVHTANENNSPLKIVQATEKVNEEQKMVMFHKIKDYFNGDLKGKIFGFWGVAFKANTDDIRESPAITMAKNLISEGAKINFFDPEAAQNFEELMETENETKGKTQRFKNKYDCLNESDGLVTMTEWREFTFPDFDELKNRLKNKVIFDARNLYDTEKVLDQGFNYLAIGKRI